MQIKFLDQYNPVIIIACHSYLYKLAIHFYSQCSTCRALAVINIQQQTQTNVILEVPYAESADFVGEEQQLWAVLRLAPIGQSQGPRRDSLFICLFQTSNRLEATATSRVLRQEVSPYKGTSIVEQRKQSGTDCDGSWRQGSAKHPPQLSEH